DFKSRGGRPEEVDQLAHFTSREILVDMSNMKHDTEIFMGLPPVRVDAVVAYGSYSAFKRENDVGVAAPGPAPQNNLLNLFGWQFLVPKDSKRSDDEILKQAVELANTEEARQHRQAFHRWRRDVIQARESS